ncbi:uncharacterized protein I303_104935 [Kwoniella dejecticola CBS 10117]|uniref:Uncharacterized protein n=1 Tax=Kwoniella dejecticola CBS 10117 TaxID=1296121 RepID=A0A1A6A3X8_9TREE|nr:uncharacterized protein I303_05619 [Kwoniella dejecticola CBS 10117]OBR84760.1 hypothetical protein I303_05619 [Kwoniella dejecticola CBS 10117]
MPAQKQTRRDLTNEEIPLFEQLKSTISSLDNINVAAYAGVIPFKDEEKNDVKLFVEHKERLKLVSFPIIEEDAKELYEAAELEGDHEKNGRILKEGKFAFTGPPLIPSYVTNRVAGQYSSPIEYKLNGLSILGEGDAITLPDGKSTEYDEYNSYIDSLTGVKYYTSIDHTERAGTLLIQLPTTYSGGGLTISKPQPTEDGIVFKTTMDWSSTPIDTDEWEIRYCYFEPPSKAIFQPVIEGKMIFLQYHIWTNDEGEYLKTKDVDRDVGREAIVQRLNRILGGDMRDGNGVLESEGGGKLGFGLSGYYDNWVEILEKEDDERKAKLEEEADGEAEEGEEKEESARSWHPQPPRTVTKEEEERFVRELPNRLKGSDAYLLDAIKKMGLDWHFEAVYNPDLEEEDEEEKVDGEDLDTDAAEAQAEADGVEAATAENEEKEDDTGEEDEEIKDEEDGDEDKLSDPTKQDDTWTSPSFYVIQGQEVTKPNTVRKALLAKGVKHNEGIYWVDTAMYHENQCWYKSSVDDEDIPYSFLQVGIAIIVDIPAKK